MNRLLLALFLIVAAPSLASAILPGVHQSCEFESATGCTTAAIATTTGSTIVIGVTWSNQFNFISVGDSATNTWTQVGTALQVPGGGDWLGLYRCQNCTGSATHTFNMLTAGGTYGVVTVQEFKNMLTSSVLDQNTTGTNTAATTYTSGNVTTTTANQALVAYTASGGGTDCTFSSAFAGSGVIGEQRCNLDSTSSGVLYYRIVTATGTYAAAITSNQTNNAATLIGTFKGNAESVATVPQRALTGVGK